MGGFFFQQKNFPEGIFRAEDLELVAHAARDEVGDDFAVIQGVFQIKVRLSEVIGLGFPGLFACTSQIFERTSDREAARPDEVERVRDGPRCDWGVVRGMNLVHSNSIKKAPDCSEACV